MIKSMTGFGKGESGNQFGRFTVEIRTVNHRYFDVSSRIPYSLGHLEESIKKYLHKYIRRGRVNLYVSHKKAGEGLGEAMLDAQAIGKYHALLSRIKKRFKLKDEIQLSHLLSFPDVIIHEEPECDESSVWPVIEKALKEAVVSCDKMRAREGKALYSDMIKILAAIKDSFDKISSLVPELVTEYKKKLDSRIKDIVQNKDYVIDKARLETELAIFAKQCDVSEEITRAYSHIEALKEAFMSDKEAGRRVEFLLQELQREINTLGSKAAGAGISGIVVDIKSNIEKLREQAQNVE